MFLRVGTVGSPHGLDGSFYVTAPNAEMLQVGATVLVAGRPRQVVRRAGTDRKPIVRLEGFAERSAAQALSGEEMLVPRDDAPALGPDEWWREDLEGCAVHDQGRLVGVVRRLLALPSCEVLEVARSDGTGELLVPLVSDAVRDVDIARREIEIDLRFLGEE